MTRGPSAARRRTAVQAGCLLAFVLTLLLALAGERYRRTCDAVCADTLRLHILANSDSPRDQWLKLQVRDAVLQELQPLLQDAENKSQALVRLGTALPALQRVAARIAGQPAQVQLEQAAFAARRYRDFSLPAGQYTALRITLGSGRGHNWFCVLYPALCMQGSTANYPTAAEDALVFGRYRVRFALWDLLTGKN